MSISGSFTDSILHTDTDPLPNPVYFSIPEAQNSHHQYHVANPRQQESGSPTHSFSRALPPSITSSSVPLVYDQDIKYDTIPDQKTPRPLTHLERTVKHGSVASQQPSLGGVSNMGVTMQADNVLYTGVAESNELRHKTLTMETKKNYLGINGDTAPDFQFQVEGLNDRKGKMTKKSSCLLCWAFGMSVMVVLALGAAAFSLAILFTGVVDFCHCPATVSENRFKALADRVLVLEGMLEVTMKATNVPPGNMDSVTTSISSSTEMSTTMALPTTTEMPTSTMPLPQRVASLDSANLYMNCSTTIEQSCTIESSSGLARCQTFLNHVYQRPREFIMDIGCVRTSDSSEQNGLSFVLEIGKSMNFVTCICYVVSLAGGTTLSRGDLTCGLRVTRCSTEATILSNITITP